MQYQCTFRPCGRERGRSERDRGGKKPKMMETVVRLRFSKINQHFCRVPISIEKLGNFPTYGVARIMVLIFKMHFNHIYLQGQRKKKISKTFDADDSVLDICKSFSLLYF